MSLGPEVTSKGICQKEMLVQGPQAHPGRKALGNDFLERMEPAQWSSTSEERMPALLETRLRTPSKPSSVLTAAL